MFTGERSVAVRDVAVSPPAPSELLVETELSAISPGTEMLVYRDEVPAGMAADETLETLEGDLSYPTRYGYAAVGRVAAVGSDVGDDWLGRQVFAFHPHQSRFTVDRDAVVPVPDGVSAAEATLLPIVETAVNFLLDGTPAVGERVIVFGAGLVGLTTLAALSAYPLDSLVAVEPQAARRERCSTVGADRAVTPSQTDTLFADREPAGADLAYELSGRPAALDDAIGVVGYDGRVIVGSWYGDKRAPLALGGQFHRNRITVESSQVSTLAPRDRGRWTKHRRLETALDTLQTARLGDLVTHRVPFEDAPDAYRAIDGTADTLQVLLSYE